MEPNKQIQDINAEFAQLVGIKKVQAFIVNNKDGEVRYYSHPSSAYRTPKGWEDFSVGILEEPVYPDFTTPYNFATLLNIQWEIFGSLGPQYQRVADESFPVNYLVTKIQAIKVCRSFGGGDLLDEYIKRVREADFDYEILEEI